MPQIASLAPRENIHIDPQRVDQIVAALGEKAGMQVVIATLEQLARALGRTLQAGHQDDLGGVAQGADQLSRLAWQIGLVTLSGVAIDVGRCAELRDRQSLAATLARLERVGRRSLTELWDRDVPL
ncbi:MULTISPECIES: hypothetical protein [unclassified Paracoccus (in: a-proteobacteria)]|uniref:hypothetical protein n=1 Tax=unclassified Paracoccus (in: a-proteobacteria) TaxID=2688777 RepID=UPI0012B268B1|nr:MULTISPECIES: hypothetical protein [unclassified Paracoccus (in: a-proteobacteria)]UXU75839.1 hypothetical protein GB879_004965 [Paracoccus sp. SMMA_5]UXU81748.1 hypothetical protein GB880_004955 [Paracoccus sp. SMMA_5_TC]